ncbi:LytTR family DNA-binding domain-containing protein [Leuconostoc suionicum]|uniref:LytTR family DNA-binding domain-containing protein n=1 Tax=Leuconostoc suionicum TaxID=1511761 RepID=UPI0021A55F00|nr:LytTR family DNA-binding domain-containing protein [Leuconostoc suionicum]MCT4377313.1 LytTR family transcriptional regulator [Leuconostoc suionicum]MDI6650076.1 LytTR family DNA-binding domain-containing protein [Leuconostoc suionicum]MDI6681458.1 LytTR family DNA-binding domain-containing protein [Leuconostoc suionicum]
MNIQIKIDKNIEEENMILTIKEMTPEYSRLISQLQNTSFKLIGIKDNKKYYLEYKEIVKIHSVDKKIYASKETSETFLLSETLKELYAKLPNNFLRISNSEIVNADKITSFEFTFGGKLKIFLNSDDATYSSRGYLQKIKEYFGI